MATPAVLALPALPVRRSVVDACTDAWARLARPGTWFSGGDRAALAHAARSSRSCALCRARADVVSPSMVTGVHDDVAGLADPVVDVVHRIAADAARLSRRWYDDVTARVLSPAELLEVIAVVANVTAVDTLHVGVGAEPPPVGDPVGGEPSREQPDGAEVRHSWVPTVTQERATGKVAQSLRQSGAAIASDDSRGYRPSNIVFALTLVPDEQVGWRRMSAALYRNPDFTLSDAQRELVATTTSSFNDCFY